MTSAGVFTGLGRSPFLADLGAGDRRVGRIVATLGLGTIAACVAVTMSFIVIVVIWILASGHGSEGLGAVNRLLLAMQNADGRDLRSALLLLIIAAPTNLAFALAFVAVAAVLARRPLRSYLTAAARVRWRLVLLGLAMAAVATAPMLVLDRMLSSPPTAMPITAVSSAGFGRALYACAAIMFLVPAAAAEELLFRGWLLKQIAAFTRRPVVLIFVTGLVFSIVHLLPLNSTLGRFVPDLIQNMLSDPGSLIFRTLLGVGFAYMTLRMGGVEFAIGAHAANNILIVIFVEPLTQKALTTVGDASVGSFLEYGILMAAYFAITEAAVRLAPLRRLGGVQLNEVSPSATTPAHEAPKAVNPGRTWEE